MARLKMDTARMKKMMPYLVRGFFLLLLLPGNILLCWMAYQELAERFPSFLFGRGEAPSTKKTFYVEFENGVRVTASYGGSQTVLEAIAGRRALTIHAGSDDISVFRTNLDDRRGTEKTPWFEDVLMLPSGNVAYHDSWCLDYNGDLQYDVMLDVEKGNFIRIGDKWEACQLDKNRHAAAMPDGSMSVWNGRIWSKQEEGDHDVEENMSDR